ALPEKKWRDFSLGVVARLKGDVAAAQAALMKPNAQLEEQLRVHPDDMHLVSELGLIDAALGRKEEALNEGRRAIELAPNAQEAMRGPHNNEGFARTQLAMICAWVDERE